MPKNSRFWETTAGDWVRATLRGGPRIACHLPRKSVSRPARPDRWKRRAVNRFVVMFPGAAYWAPMILLGVCRFGGSGHPLSG
jgi:hypothetical protein